MAAAAEGTQQSAGTRSSVKPPQRTPNSDHLVAACAALPDGEQEHCKALVYDPKQRWKVLQRLGGLEPHARGCTTLTQNIVDRCRTNGVTQQAEYDKGQVLAVSKSTRFAVPVAATPVRTRELRAQC